MSAGVTYYLDKLSDESEDLGQLTGKVSFSNAGVAGVLENYGSYLNTDENASIEELDIATQFVPRIRL